MNHDVSSGEGRAATAAPENVRGPGPDGLFGTVINAVPVSFKDATPTGKRMLEKAGLTPPGDHVLIQLLGRSSRSIGLDETVDLRAAGTEKFRAFVSDRIFRFTFNQHGFEWGASTIAEAELRDIAGVRDNEVIVLERDGADTDLGPTDVIDLGGEGTEHLRTEKKLITVYFEDQPREIPRGVYTTEQFRLILGVKEGYDLEYIDAEGRLTVLKPGKKLRVKEGMQFFEQVPCGASS